MSVTAVRHESGLLVFEAVGRPPVQGSMRPVVSRSTGKVFLKPSSGDRLGEFRHDLAVAVRRLEGFQRIEGAVAVSLLIHLERPKTHYRTGRNAHLLRDNAPARPLGKPDVDKVLRAVLDGLTSAGVWRDDAQVVSEATSKVYAPGRSWLRFEVREL